MLLPLEVNADNEATQGRKVPDRISIDIGIRGGAWSKKGPKGLRAERRGWVEERALYVPCTGHLSLASP